MFHIVLEMIPQKIGRLVVSVATSDDSLSRPDLKIEHKIKFVFLYDEESGVSKFALSSSNFCWC